MSEEEFDDDAFGASIDVGPRLRAMSILVAKFGDVPELVTLTIGTYERAAATGDVDQLAKLRLSWGVGRASQEAVLDALDGTVITIAATTA